MRAENLDYVLDRETFLQVLKGPPLSVLMALWLFGGMSQKEIEARTGWKKDAVSAALAFLEDLNLVARPHYRQWTVAAGFYQLPLPFARQLPAGTVAALPAGAESRPGRASAVAQAEPPAAESRSNRISERASAAESRFNHVSSYPQAVDKSATGPPAEAESRFNRTSRHEAAAAQSQFNRTSRAESRFNRTSEVALEAERRFNRTSEPESRFNRTSQPESQFNRISGPDHDHADNHSCHDMKHAHDHDGPEPEKEPAKATLVARLEGLRPPLDYAAQWLEGVDVDLVSAWLDYVDGMSERRRGMLASEAAFVRAKVEQGQWNSPALVDKRKRPIEQLMALLLKSSGTQIAQL